MEVFEDAEDSLAVALTDADADVRDGESPVVVLVLAAEVDAGFDVGG